MPSHAIALTDTLRGAARSVVRNPQMAVSLLLLIICLVGIFGAPLLASADPLTQAVVKRLKPPSWQHPFGTDQLGRDVFSRVLYGGRASLPAAFAVVLIGATFGTVVGALAGSSGRLVSDLIMRITDMFLAFPVLVLAMAVAAALGASLIHGVIALTVVWWPAYARVCRSIVIDLREREYVVASRAAGRSSIAVLFRTILPNALPPIIVMAAIDVGRAILNFSILSFLGLGARPPAPEWGSMVSAGAEVMDQWWVSTFPGLAILLIVFSFNLLGDSIRDAMDPWVGGRK